LLRCLSCDFSAGLSIPAKIRIVITSPDHEIDVLIRARYPLLYIVSPEEERVEDALRRIVNGRRFVQAWSVSQPFTRDDWLDKNAPATLDGAPAAVQALDYVLRRVRDEGARGVFVLRDLDAYLDHPLVVRRLRDAIQTLKRSHSTLVILSPVLRVPPHLEKEIAVVDYPLPGFEELGEVLDELMRRAGEAAPPLDAALREQLAQAALGLTADEAANAFSKALVIGSEAGTLDASIVLAEKKQVIRKTRALEFYEAQSDWAQIGGLEQLKAWLQTRGAAFSEAAREFGLPAPRGVLLLGVPGCGKSLTAKTIGAAWRLPLLRFDVSRVFGKYVGESEANLRRALRAAEAVAPCVLWVDELEKAFAAARGEDGGVSARLLGGFLSWLQEKQAPVFVVATANSIKRLPPELLRKGRLDEIFFVGLPDEAERAAIFAIHLQKRGRAPERFALAELARQSREYSGAEIESVVISALYGAFEAGREVVTQDIEASLRASVPLARTMPEEIAALREWAATRARSAS
jgi:SpoVK/Ycf46/Vps4 family AAA+-type ATPase